MASMEVFKKFLLRLDPGDNNRNLSLAMMEIALAKNDIGLFREILTPWIQLIDGRMPHLLQFFRKILNQLAQEEVVAETLVTLLNYAANGGNDEGTETRSEEE